MIVFAMPQNTSSPHFNTNFDPKTGHLVQLGPDIARVCAPNRGAYTFTGTNSYLVGNDEIIIIDPGPNDAAHFDALIRAIKDRPVKGILLTHTHKDHSGMATRLQNHIKAPLWFGGRHKLSRPRRLFEINLLHGACDWKLTPDQHLRNGDIVEVENTRLEVIATPGHCANHLCFGVQGSPYLFSGDHVMGWNSTLVATPDGSMADYFNSLDHMAELKWRHYFPGHGAPIEDLGPKNNGLSFARALRTHRAIRNQQILDQVANGATSVQKIVSGIYPEVSTKIKIAAAMTVVAHIEYLEDKGLLVVKRNLLGHMALSPA